MHQLELIKQNGVDEGLYRSQKPLLPNLWKHSVSSSPELYNLFNLSGRWHLQFLPSIPDFLVTKASPI